MRTASLLALLLFGLAWTRHDSVRPVNVLLITIDLWGADRLNLKDAPRVRELMEQGLTCSEAYAQSSRTEAATRCLLASRFVSQFMARTDPLGADNVSLAQILKARGYETAAFLADSAFKYPVGRTTLKEGFDAYDVARCSDDSDMEIHGYRPGMRTTSAAIQWIESRSGRAPWFTWLMLWDLHFTKKAFGVSAAISGEGDADSKTVRYEDACVRQILEALNRSGQSARTLVVVTANHASPWDKRPKTIYQSTLHVPLVFWAPNVIQAGQRIESPVMHVDVVPTILELLRCPPVPCAGVSLLRPQEEDRPIYAETPSLEGRSIRTGRWKYIEYIENFGLPPGNANQGPPDPDHPGAFLFAQAGAQELYDLATDPNETTNLIEKAPSTAETLQRKVKRWQAASGHIEPAVMDAKQIELLRRNGYWTDTNPSPRSSATP